MSRREMTQEIIMAGFGGQGVISMGIILANAGMLEDKHVTFFPSYGAEMRGGTANCSVVISREPIASPVVAVPDIVIALNEPSLLRFESQVKPGGLLFYNETLIKSKPSRQDIKIVPVGASAAAEAMGSGRIANMVMLGSYAKKAQAISLESLKKAQKLVFRKATEQMIRLNNTALEHGFGLV